MVTLGYPPNSLILTDRAGKSRERRYSKANLARACEGLLDLYGINVRSHTGAKNKMDYDAMVCITLSDATFSFKSANAVSELWLQEQRLERGAEVLDANYAYAFNLQYHRGPVLYAMGISYGLEWTYEEKEQISRWGHTAVPEKVFADGFIRDVFPLNLLNESHVTRKFDEGFLSDVIDHYAIGTISPRQPGHYLWSVPSDRLDEARDVARKIGLSF